MNKKILIPIIATILLGGGVLAWYQIRPIIEPVVEPVVDPVIEPVIEPAIDPVVEPVINIIVNSPISDQIITNPVRVAGMSDTFEANVRIRIKDDNNKILADTFTMGGTMGMMESFTKDVFYIKPSTLEGVIEVFQESPKDGAEIRVISVPVIFGPYKERIVNIRVISPNGRERWEAGRNYKVKWEAVGAEKITAFLILSKEEADKENCIESFRLISHMSADWDGGEVYVTIPINTCLSDRYKVKICDFELWTVGDLEACDKSDNYFSIINWR